MTESRQRRHKSQQEPENRRHMPLTQLTREGVKYAVYGCLGEVGRRLRQSGVPILTYHSVDESGSRMSLSACSFRRQMEFLSREGFSSISLSTFATVLRSGEPLPSRSFVLTFDDGFRSVYEHAFPVMQELAFTATIFPVTGYLGKTCGWDVGPFNRRRGADRLPLMTWSQIEEMSASGFEFGSHGARHLRLADESADAVREDLRMSKQEIEDRLSRPCTMFCYPYGDYSDHTRDIVQETGFEAAVTLRFGWNDPPVDPYFLRRVGSARFTNMQVFKASMYRMYGWHIRGRNGDR